MLHHTVCVISTAFANAFFGFLPAGFLLIKRLMAQQKTCLVVIYNHNFEKNIPIIKKIYGKKFSYVIQLMPFYTGNDSDVLRVFGNSFQFHGFIAQKRQALAGLECDRYLFIGDDLLLNPQINENSLDIHMRLEENSCFFPEMHDVSKGEFVRGSMEAASLKIPPSGLDPTALCGIPSFAKAFEILQKKDLMQSSRLSKLKPFYPCFFTPLNQNWLLNYSVLRGRIWHFLNMLKFRLRGCTAAYPVVFGYSDIFSLPKAYFNEFCNFLEIFASVGMFVELAIPTTFALHDWCMVFEKDLPLRPLNVWFPQDPHLYRHKIDQIACFEQKANWKIHAIESQFPKDFLYLHPIKLSRWT